MAKWKISKELTEEKGIRSVPFRTRGAIAGTEFTERVVADGKLERSSFRTGILNFSKTEVAVLRKILVKGAGREIGVKRELAGEKRGNRR